MYVGEKYFQVVIDLEGGDGAGSISVIEGKVGSVSTSRDAYEDEREPDNGIMVYQDGSEKFPATRDVIQYSHGLIQEKISGKTWHSSRFDAVVHEGGVLWRQQQKILKEQSENRWRVFLLNKLEREIKKEELDEQVDA
jgi:hypothetical protein